MTADVQRRRLPSRGATMWDDAMSLADLKAQLDVAIDAEDYETAASIRDALQ